MKKKILNELRYVVIGFVSFIVSGITGYFLLKIAKGENNG